MIIPVRCVTCGKVLANKWRYYQRKLVSETADHKEDLKEDPEPPEGARAKVLDELGLTRYCCRRHMLGHVDLVDKI